MNAKNKTASSLITALFLATAFPLFACAASEEKINREIDVTSGGNRAAGGMNSLRF